MLIGSPEMRFGRAAFGAAGDARFYTTSVRFVYSKGSEARGVPCGARVRDGLSASWREVEVSAGSGMVGFGIGLLRRRTGWWGSDWREVKITTDEHRGTLIEAVMRASEEKGGKISRRGRRYKGRKENPLQTICRRTIGRDEGRRRRRETPACGRQAPSLYSSGRRHDS